MPTTPGEPDGAPRLPILDVLRGVAILGILFMNISDMGGSLFAFFAGDVRRLGWTGADQAVWWVREVLADGTARCLLEMLFGVGMVILTERAAARMGRWQVLRGYAWRNLVLFAFGVMHVVLLLWPGDILHSYALAALIAMWFRNFRPRWLLVFGLVMATLQMVGVSAGVIASGQQRQEVQRIETKARAGQAITPAERKALADARKANDRRNKDRADIMARAAAEDRARSGTALTWAQALWGAAWWLQSSGLEALIVWEAASTMLVGAALYKLGVIQGGRSRTFYLRLMIAAYAIAGAARGWDAWGLTRFDGELYLASAFGEYARILMTVGHVALINLLVMGAAGGRWVHAFAAAGRTALTLYVVQTVITLWLVYPPWGLALYGRQSWIELMLTALAIDAALLALAVWWVRRFAIAPVEWAWRSLVAGRALPFRPRAALA